MTVEVIKNGLTLAAEEDLALSLLFLREGVADSSCFRALVHLQDAEWATVKDLADADTADRDKALEAIYFDRIDGEGEFDGTVKCMLRPLNDGDMVHVAPGQFDVSGIFFMRFEFPIPKAYEPCPELAVIDFLNKARRCVREIRSQPFAAERLWIQRIAQGPMGQLDPTEANNKQVRCSDYMVHFMGSEP